MAVLDVAEGGVGKGRSCNWRLDLDIEFQLRAAEDVDAAVLLYVSQSRAHLPQAGWGAPESVVR